MNRRFPLYGLYICFLVCIALYFENYTAKAYEMHLSAFDQSSGLKCENSKNQKYRKANNLVTINREVQSEIIPFKRIGRLIVIESTVDGQSGNFIFDTGSTSLVLNRTYFRDHISKDLQTSSGITGSLGREDKITIDNLTVGTLSFKKITAHTANLGHIENKRGIRVLGLFGFQLINRYEVVVDLVNNQIRLNPVDRKGNLLDTCKMFKPDYVQKIQVANNIIFLEGVINEKKLWFCFDTGAETNALSSRLPDRILQTISITRTTKLRGAGSYSNEVIYGRMNHFQYGDSLFRNMETIVTYLDHLNDAYGVQIDGILGFDFITKGSFCINFVKKQIGISYIKQPQR